MEVKFFQKKSPYKKECEDAYVRNDTIQVYGVCDGATPLVTFEDENGHNGAYLASHLFQSYFESLSREEDIVECMVQANHILANKMMQYNIDQTKKHHLWSTCFAGVRIGDSAIQYGQLGDCMIVAKFVDDRIALLTKDTVKGINARAQKNRLERGYDEKYYADERRRFIYNRWMANTKGGYSVANGMENVREYIQTGTIKRSDVKALFVCSDGLFHPTFSLEQVASVVWKDGIQGYVSMLDVLEQKNGIRADDKTALTILL